jgi:transposase
VPSQSGTGQYRVDADATTCTCKDFELHAKPCKHIHAVKIVKARNRATQREQQAFEDAYANAECDPKPTYKQDWPNYNKAQMNEKRLFCELLSDLCSTIPEPERKSKKGRPPVPLADLIFSAIYKVYSGFSARRFTTDMNNAGEDGHVEHAPHFNVVLRALEDTETTAILTRLVTESSLPLKAIETDFAVDSSGFSSSKFIRWFDVKHGAEKRKAEWVKVHICTGVKTNVVTAVRIGGEHDGQHLNPLLKTTAENFKIGEVSADKAYLSAEALEYIESLNGKPYIPFKTNSRADKNGKTRERLYHQFALNRDEFCEHYHERSNVESTFSMVKRKFGGLQMN